MCACVHARIVAVCTCIHVTRCMGKSARKREDNQRGERERERKREKETAQLEYRAGITPKACIGGSNEV